MKFDKKSKTFAIKWQHSVGAALAGAALLVACGGSDPTPADVVFKNGQVYTADAADTLAQAVAVRNGVIVYVGTDSGVQAHVGTATQVIDLAGRMLMPGLVDGHVHPIMGGAATLKCSLDYLPLTVAQMRDKIQTCLDASVAKEPDAWLEVVNWDRQAMGAKDRDPTRQDLDSLVTQRPIQVSSIDYHTSFVNSRGLALAGISASTPTPAGGSIAKDPSGQPTGILEDAAGELVTAIIPAPTDEDRVQHARIALDMMRRQGVTTFMNAMSSEPEIKAFATLAQTDELTARSEFALLIGHDDAENIDSTLTHFKAIAGRYQSAVTAAKPGVEVRHVKFFMDGVIQAPAQTAAMLAPYNINQGTAAAPNWVPGTGSGSMYFTPELLTAAVVASVKAGFEPHVHAIGDAAVRRTLDVFQAARTQLPSTPFRAAISHAEAVDPADYPRFKQLDVVPVMSFQWAQRAPYSLDGAESQLGPERFERMEPFGSLSDAGARVAYGSDWPIDPMAHFYNLRVGVTRSGDPSHFASFGPDYAGKLNNAPALSRTNALRSATANAAYQLGLDDKIGTVQKGKYADLIVLDRNFLTEGEDRLAHTEVTMTMVGGKFVWSTDNAVTGASTRSPLSPSVSDRKGTFNVKASTGHVPVLTGDGHRH